MTRHRTRVFSTVVLLASICPSSAVGQVLGVESPDSVGGRPRYSIALGGWLKLHGVSDFTGSSNPSALSPPSIPVGDVERDPQFGMDMYQSRIKIDSRYVPADFPSLRAYVETDFYGGGGGSLRLRHFYLDIGGGGPGLSGLVGQTWSGFADADAWPNMTDFDGPPTGVWKRTAQLRVQWTSASGHEFLAALESPSSDLGRAAEVDSLVLDSNQTIPEVAVGYRKAWTGGHVRLGGIYRVVRYRSEASEDFRQFRGWGVVVSGIVQTTSGGDLLTYQLLTGRGIAGYMVGYSGLGLDAIPDLDGGLTGAPVWGGYLGYQHFWSDRWSSTAVAGSARVENDVLDFVGDISQTAYGSVNLYWHPLPGLGAGVEFLYGYNREPTPAEPLDGESGEGARVQFTVEYAF